MSSQDPIQYSSEIASILCEYIAGGESVRQVCAHEGMPNWRTIFKWIGKHEEFGQQYARACESRAIAMAEEILDIADDGTNDFRTREGKNGPYEEVDYDHIQRSKLRVDTRKWLMSKMAPKKYGAIAPIQTGGDDDHTFTVENADDDIPQRR